jgi:hypothetical protein
MRIPEPIAERVLAARRQTYASNAEAWVRRALREGRSPELPPHAQEAGLSLEEAGGSGLLTRPLLLDRELRFWEIKDDGELEDFLFDDLLNAFFGGMEEPAAHEWRSLPSGYRPLSMVLEFERHCQFEGWTAVENRFEDLPDIIAAYRFVGLGDEADALVAVKDAFESLAGDDGEADERVLGTAYKSVPNATPEYEDRVPRLLAFVRANPGLFA